MVNYIEQLQKKIKLYFIVDTLDYLYRGGRIGKASHFIGSILNIKPILSLDEEGVVYSVDKARGERKALHRIIELLQENITTNTTNHHLIVAHAAAPQLAEQWMESIKSQIQVSSISTANIGPVIGVHTGVGTVGVCIFSE